MQPPLRSTLERLNALIKERGLDRPALLNARDLAARTALPESTVRTLLGGGSPPSDTVEERVCARVKTLADAYLARHNLRVGELVAVVATRLNISPVWARKLLAGEKLPNVPLLHGLAEFFDVEGGESFFTAPAADAVNRVLSSELRRLEGPEPEDPVQALMKKYGVVATDLRQHGSMTPDQLERLLEGVFRSVFPPTEDNNR